MIKKYVVDQILDIYNYIDALVLTNKDGIIQYYKIFNDNNENTYIRDAVGKNVLELHPTLTKETSSIIRVLNNKKPIYQEHQYLKIFKGKPPIHAIATTLPVKVGEEIIGVVDILRFLEINLQKKEIKVISMDDSKVTTNDDLYQLKDIITVDKKLIDLKEKIENISKTNSSVLIYGKTGTGKEMVAQSIHSLSNRCNKPFISQNCAAIPFTLLESILFGTVKGSYTGAEDRKGLFELANGGTIFLDEINSMDINMQSKILSVIENKKIRRIGGSKIIKVDVRIISAINEDPMDLIAKKRLREDLFYRLNVVQINLPNLENRKSDILVLAKHFINYYNKVMNKRIIGLSKEAENILMNYSWHGNIRELKNVIEGSFNIAKGKRIEVCDLPEYIKRKEERKFYKPKIKLGSTSLTQMLESYEKEIISEAMKESKKINDISKLLKISRQSLKYKINKYGL